MRLSIVDGMNARVSLQQGTRKEPMEDSGSAVGNRAARGAGPVGRGGRGRKGGGLLFFFQSQTYEHQRVSSVMAWEKLCVSSSREARCCSRSLLLLARR